MARSGVMSNAKVMTPEFRVSFPNVFQARADFDGMEPRYSITMLFSKKTDISALKQMAQAVAKEKYGDKPLPKNFRNPFRDGDAEKPDMDGYAGTIFVSAKSKGRPGLVDATKTPIINQEDFYAGCYARATVSCYCYDKAGNVGVAFGLQNIQKLRDGDPFSGKTKAEDDFDAVSTDAPATTATGGMFD